MKTKAIQSGFVFVIKTAMLFCAVGLTVAGCASAPEIYPPDQVPSYVREIKTLRLYAHIEKKDTQIELAAGEYVSIMVEGKIRFYQERTFGGCKSLERCQMDQRWLA